jgi:bifunctional non-homologous end joining protein LigD
MAAELVQALPDGDDWIYEVKWDGYRALLLKHGDTVDLRSRRDKSLTADYPQISAAGLKLKAGSAVVDGEVVALGADGRPSFQALQHRSTHGSHAVVFYAFDVLSLDGDDLTRRPLHERKALLEPVIAGTGILFSASLPGTAAQVREAVGRLGLEGVVAKRRSSLYRPGVRSDAWLKLKLERQQEFVVGGFRPGPHGVDALLVGYYEGASLKFAAKVRAGFTPRMRRTVAEAFQPLQTGECPFADLPNSKTSHWGGGVTAEQMAEMRWLTPSAVAQIRFVEWTADGHLRHAAFMGLRHDKAAADVHREA